VVGQQPEPNVPEGWVRVKVSHASLNRHDVFTLRGISGHVREIHDVQNRSGDALDAESFDEFF
jgi:NADPH:quinone reductase-like Zn-dependent oxidoreductase